MSLQYTYCKLSFEETRAFLLETNTEYPTPLSSKVDIESYAKKLSEYSDFSICMNEKGIIGMISCYTNRPPIGFISNVCVMDKFQGKGVFSHMFKNLISHVKDLGIRTLRLEVDINNERAQSIYIRHGFNMVETNINSSKLLMELMIL